MIPIGRRYDNVKYLPSPTYCFDQTSFPPLWMTFFP